MKLSYVLNLEDYVNFSLHYHRQHINSPEEKRKRRLATNLTWSVMLFCAFLYVLFKRSQPDASWQFNVLVSASFTIIVGLVSAPFYWLLLQVSRWYVRRMIAAAARKHYGTGENRVLFGPQHLSLIGDELVSQNQVSNSNLKLSSIERIDITDDYAFIFASTVSAYILPRRTVTEGDFDQFIKAVTSSWEARRP